MKRLLLILALVAILFSIPLQSAAAATKTISPIANVNLSGSSTGGVAALKTMDGTTFMTFKTTGEIYKGYRNYKLPVSLPRASVTSLTFKVRYRGLPAGSQTWSWFALNWSTNTWTKIGTNQGAQNNVWKTFVFTIPNPKAYIHDTGVIRILLQSNNATGDAKIDYEGVIAMSGTAPNIPAKCKIFPANNIWNTPINSSKIKVHANSTKWVNSIGANTNFHMDFGSGEWNGGPIGIPYNVVSGSNVTKYYPVFQYEQDSDKGPYPIPNNPAIESGSDSHLLVVDTDPTGCKLYEIYDASFSGGKWYGGSGAIFNLNSNALRKDGWTSADAAGLPMLAGLARYQEIEAALQQADPNDRIIPHALRFTVPCSPAYHIWPARHHATHGSCSTPVPFGARFRLKANYDISGFHPVLQVLLRTMKVYGIINADNGGPWVISGVPDSRWNDDMLHDLDVLKGSNFEAVDTLCMRVNASSGQASLANCP